LIFLFHNTVANDAVHLGGQRPRHMWIANELWIATHCDCDRVGTGYFPLLRLIRLGFFEWMLIITPGFLFSNADILFSLVGRVFRTTGLFEPPPPIEALFYSAKVPSPTLHFFP
jgi:hypothetical protein